MLVYDDGGGDDANNSNGDYDYNDEDNNAHSRKLLNLGVFEHLTIK